MEAKCQCGNVSFQTPSSEPLALYICHCESCRRQTGSAFGTSAIFPKFRLPDSSQLRVYKKLSSSGHTMFCYFCQTCGTRLLHATPNRSVVSVKGGCLIGLDWSKAIHIWTKQAMVPIPEGSESYSEESEYMGYRGDQEELDQPMCDSSSPATSVTLQEDMEHGRAQEPQIEIHGLCELSGKV